MKIIDLLSKIANGEKIKEFKYDGSLFELDDGVYRQKNGQSLDDYCFIEECLNDEIYEVKVIEDNKKIEPITLDDWIEFTTKGDIDNIDYMFNKNSRTFVDKINEIIDKLNEGE